MAEETNSFKKGLQVDNYPLAPLEEPNDRQREKLYRAYVDSQSEHFLAFLNYINNILAILKFSGRIVSDSTHFHARIKSTESALNNDKKEGKALNDVFGLEIDCASEGEKAFVLELLRNTLNETKSKVHNKPNGYVASHVSGFPARGSNIVQSFDDIINTTYNPIDMYTSEVNKFSPDDTQKLEDPQINKEITEYFMQLSKSLNETIDHIKKIPSKHLKTIKSNLKIAEQAYQKSEELKTTKSALAKNPDLGVFPIIECKFLTIDRAIEANLGAANHGDYKGENIGEIQKIYDRDGKLPLSRIPRMYWSSIRIEPDGTLRPVRMLSNEEALRLLYPSLITNVPLKLREGDSR